MSQAPESLSRMVAYVQGEFVPALEASVSVYDRGLRWGEAAYDVERTFRGRIFRLDDHLARLFRVLRYVRIPCPLSADQMAAAAEELVRRNRAAIAPESDLEVAQVVTRGPLWDGAEATVVMYCREIDWPKLAERYRKGVPLVVSSLRAFPSQCLSPASKTTNKMPQRLAELEAAAIQPGAAVLMLDTEGHVAEGSSANFFFVREGVLRTPTVRNCLPGISRMTTLELAAELGIPAEEGTYSLYDLADADEAFLTSTTPCMYGVTSVNGQPLRAPFPGPVYCRLLDAWKRRIGFDFVAQALSRGGGG